MSLKADVRLEYSDSQTGFSSCNITGINNNTISSEVEVFYSHSGISVLTSPSDLIAGRQKEGKRVLWSLVCSVFYLLQLQ